MRWMKIISSILIPPFGVYLQKGLSKTFWINLLLTGFGVIPGIIHALWCLSDEKPSLSLDRLIRRN
jgi:uncharacterized membrane protein YqaE (UPF0057 family)